MLRPDESSTSTGTRLFAVALTQLKLCHDPIKGILVISNVKWPSIA